MLLMVALIFLLHTGVRPSQQNRNHLCCLHRNVLVAFLTEHLLQILSSPLSNCLWENASRGKVLPQLSSPAQMRASSLVVHSGHRRLAPRSSCLCEDVSASTNFLHFPHFNRQFLICFASHCCDCFYMFPQASPLLRYRFGERP